MISKNKIRLMSGILAFLQKNANLVDYELRISEFILPFSVNIVNDSIYRFQLYKKSSFFKTEVWTLVWNRKFNERVSLPFELCNPSVQARLTKDMQDAEQNRQATLFHDDSGA